MGSMETLELARWQFAITTIYHFLFVPVTIGMATMVAILQTAWHRTGDEEWLKLTRFFGKLLLINFAIGVVTGIVQEFQFGMNWSEYSRYVGDIFGAPLAMEALIAFFLESTFLGLWIFGWDRLPRKVHLATIWAVAVGTSLSAYFIIAANSWMQHPVGYKIAEGGERAEMTSILAVVTNSTALYAYAHTILSAFAVAGMLLLAVSAWNIRQGRSVASFHRTAVIGIAVAVPAAILVALTGHATAQLMTKQQPMKMAAAEALWETRDHAPMSLFATGDFERNPGHTNTNVLVPDVLSILATNSPSGTVKGIDQVQAEERSKYGPGDYVPIVAVTYWGFRIMVGCSMLMALVGIIGALLLYRGRLNESRNYLRIATWAVALPFIANTAGWMFTELGRQPWVVYGLLKTKDAVSHLDAWEVGLTVVGFTALYGALAVVEFWLFRRYATHDLDHATPPADELGERSLSMLY